MLLSLLVSAGAQLLSLLTAKGTWRHREHLSGPDVPALHIKHVGHSKLDRLASLFIAGYLELGSSGNWCMLPLSFVLHKLPIASLASKALAEASPSAGGPPRHRQCRVMSGWGQRGWLSRPAQGIAASPPAGGQSQLQSPCGL